MNTFRINSNPASVLAYRNLSRSQFNLQTTLERLSSGLRINEASDDSAGSAISTRMSNQIQGMKQANENGRQANNLIQTAESGLNDIRSMLSRMRELATQAATDTLNNSDRASINLEFQTLKNEISRVAHATEYNEMNLLNGTDYKNEVHRVNTTADDVIGISVKNADLSHDIRKGIYTLRDEHVDVSGLADISNLSNTAITGIRYSSSSLQPALGETYTVKSQVNSGVADINNLSITDVSQLRHSTSPVVLPGDHTIISRLDASDRANISGLSNTSITEIRHDATSVVRPGDHTIISRLDASDRANISGLTTAVPSITEIRQNASSVVQPGDHTIISHLDASDPANISGLSNTSITEIRHNASSAVQLGDHTISARLDASDRADISGLSGTAITEIRHDATSVVQPGDYVVSTKANAGTADISNLSSTSINQISHGSSPTTRPGNYTVSSKANAGTADISNLSSTSINQISHGSSPTTRPGNYTVSTKVNAGTADISNLSSTSINQISHGSSPTTRPGNYTVSTVETAVSADHALQFDGINDYVELPDFSSLQDMSFSGWVKIDSRNYWERIFDFGRGGSGDMFLSTMGGRTGGNLEMTIHPFGGTHTIDPGVTLEDGEWHHVVFTYDKGGSGMKLYIDGVNKGSNSYNTASFADFGGGQNFYLGKANWNDPYFDGAMDEVGIFNTALTANEVSAIYNEGSGIDLASDSGNYQSASNLKGYWKFNEGSGTTVTDLSGNGSHATLINGPTPIEMAPASTARTLRVTAPDTTTSEVAYSLTDTSIDFSSLGLHVDTSDASSMTSALLNSPQTFTVNPTLSVTSPNNVVHEVGYEFNNTSSAADTITFDLIIGNSSNGGENADGGEEIVLEYSLDGSSWTHMETYAVGSYTNWTSRTVNVPEVAQTPSTQFRWRQLDHSGSSYDHWGLDNVQVGAEDYDNFDPNTDDAKWSSISGATAWSGNGSGSDGGFTSGGGHNNALQFRSDGARQAVTNAMSVSGGGQQVSFSGLGLDLETVDSPAMTAALLNDPKIFTVNPTLSVTPPVGSAAETDYTFNSSSQTVSFSSLGINVDASNAGNMTDALFGTPKTFTVNPTLSVTPPVGSAAETDYTFNSNSQTVSFSSLGIDVDASNAGNMTDALFGTPKTFTVDAKLKVTAPDNTAEEIRYSSSSEFETVSFGTLGLAIDSGDAEQTATQLLSGSQTFRVNPTLSVTAPDNTVAKSVYDYGSNSQTVNLSGLGLQVETNNAIAMTSSLLDGAETFTVDARLKATAPDNTVEEIKYSSSSESQTVSFDTLGLEIDSSDAEQTATQLLNNSQGFTVDTKLKVTAPDNTVEEIGYSSSSESQTVSFDTLGLAIDSGDAEQTATQLLNNSQGFRVNPTLSVTAPDNTVAKSVYDYGSNSQTVTLSGLGLQVETDNAIAMTSSLLDGAEGFTVDARLKATAPDNTVEEIKYSSSSESQTVSFDTLGLEIDSSDAEQTATQLLNNSQGFTVDTRLKATIPDGTHEEIKYSSSSESQTVSFSNLGFEIDSNNAQTTATQLLNTSRDFTVNPTLAINSPNTAPVEESGYQFHGNPQTVDFSRLGLEVDTSDASGMTTTLLGSPQDFFVPETRKLTMTGENGMQQSLEYRVGYDTTLNFDDFGIQLDIKSSPDPAIPSTDSYNPHNDSLDGTQIEIAPNRDLQVGADNDVNHQLKLGITSVTSSGLKIGNESVVDIDQARAAITSLDTAIDVVNQERSYLASEQNRLAFTLSNLTSQTQNIESSRSSIQDADFASEAMNLTKAQILSQSSSAVLAQANALTQNLLSLLR